MMEVRYSFATLNSNNFIVYGQKIICGYSFSWLERADHFETKIEQMGFNFLFCIKPASSTVTPFKERTLLCTNGLGN